MGYRIVEPHPSAPRTAIHTSRGGAGNAVSLKNTPTTPGPTATGPASLTRLDTRTPAKRFITGRGGAGNIHHAANEQRPMFSFDEELEQIAKREQRHRQGAAPVYTAVGRGGVGNLIPPPERAEQLKSSYLQHHRESGQQRRASSSSRTSENSEEPIDEHDLARMQSNRSSTSSVFSKTSSVAGSVKRHTMKSLSRVFSR